SNATKGNGGQVSRRLNLPNFFCFHTALLISCSHLCHFLCYIFRCKVLVMVADHV
uniref:Uncharacterized protein n=1 Tax=Aegilops tauschii subsp. strangulata TaxID=200361 RepID=A0A453Q3K7_AEGTS